MKVPGLDAVKTFISWIGQKTGNQSSRASEVASRSLDSPSYAQVPSENNFKGKITGLKSLSNLITKVQSSITGLFERAPITGKQIIENPQKYLPILGKKDLLRADTLLAIEDILSIRDTPEDRLATREPLIKMASLLLESPLEASDSSENVFSQTEIPTENTTKNEITLFTAIARHVAYENLPDNADKKVKTSLAKDSSISSPGHTESLKKLTKILSLLEGSVKDMPQLVIGDLATQEKNLKVPLAILQLTAKLTRFLKNSDHDTKASPELKKLLDKADTLQRNVLNVLIPFVKNLTNDADKKKQESNEFNKNFDENPENALENRTKPYVTADLRSSLWRDIIPTLLRLPLDSIKDADVKVSLEEAHKRQFGGPIPTTINRNSYPKEHSK